MLPNPQFPAVSVTFTEEIIHWKLHFLAVNFARMEAGMKHH